MFPQRIRPSFGSLCGSNIALFIAGGVSSIVLAYSVHCTDIHTTMLTILL